MNGRIYDPTLGRFLQADPHIQAPTNSQSYNRYSYVLNNPMSYTDPSGYFFKKLGKFVKKYWRVIAAAVVTYFTAGAAGHWAAGWAAGAFGAGTTAAAVAGGMLTGAIAGAAGGFVATGSLKGTLTGAFTGAVFGGLGGYGKAMQWGKEAFVGAHSMAGGVLSELQGGKSGHGFITAGVMKGVGMGIDGNVDMHDAGKTVIMAIAGGTVSKITGGKFANGAVTSAMQFVVNQIAKTLKRRVDVLDPKEQDPVVESVKRKRVYSSWIGSPPPGVKAAPQLAWGLVDASVMAEYEVKYTTTSTETTQETVTTQWLEDSSGNVSNVGQRATVETLSVDYNTSVSVTQLGIVGTTRLPSNAQIVTPTCIQNNMKGC